MILNGANCFSCNFVFSQDSTLTGQRKRYFSLYGGCQFFYLFDNCTKFQTNQGWHRFLFHRWLLLSRRFWENNPPALVFCGKFFGFKVDNIFRPADGTYVIQSLSALHAFGSIDTAVDRSIPTRTLSISYWHDVNPFKTSVHTDLSKIPVVLHGAVYLTRN